MDTYKPGDLVVRGQRLFRVEARILTVGKVDPMTGEHMHIPLRGEAYHVTFVRWLVPVRKPSDWATTERVAFVDELLTMAEYEAKLAGQRQNNYANNKLRRARLKGGYGYV